MVPVSVLHMGRFAPVDTCEPPQPLAVSCREEVALLLLKNVRGFHPPRAGLGSPCGVSGDEVMSAAAEEGQAEFGHPKLSYMEVQRS